MDKKEFVDLASTEISKLIAEHIPHVESAGLGLALVHLAMEFYKLGAKHGVGSAIEEIEKQADRVKYDA